MKTLTKTLIAAAFAATSLVATANPNDENAISKSRALAEKASLSDWKTPAETAALLICHKTNLSEAAIWIDRSIAIRPTSYNLTVKGDYYMLKNQPEKAMAAYISALETGAEQETNFDTTSLQEKIAAIVEMN